MQTSPIKRFTQDTVANERVVIHILMEAALSSATKVAGFRAVNSVNCDLSLKHLQVE